VASLLTAADPVAGLKGRDAMHYLRGVTYEHPPRPELADFDLPNTWYFADARKTVRPKLDAARRRATVDEVVGGLRQDTALFEARRCLSCGNCLACDNCYGVCPDDAVIKLTPGGAYQYEIDLDFCKGCGICVHECPAGAIALEIERT
jgi:Pyruvate/2-oxoacid:ferredoxin oxidoreductase delta subunit